MSGEHGWLTELASRVAAVQELAAIRGEIEVMAGHVAVATPSQQRLHFTRWIAQARRNHTGPRRRWTDEGVRRIARTLEGLARIWWPGSTPALARTTRPTEALSELGVVGATWDQVIERADRALLGARGWADDDALDPRPHDPGGRFLGIIRELEALGGALGEAADLRAAIATARTDVPRLVRLAGEVRWLRGAVDRHAWGAAIGRLRGLARRLRAVDLDALLDPGFSPTDGWAATLGEDPRRDRLLAERPGPASGDAALAAWLEEAFDAEIDVAALVAGDATLRERLAAFPATSLAERRYRRKLAKIVGGAPAREVTGPEVLRAPALEIPDRRDVDDEGLTELRAKVAGKRALFVTNRPSPEIAATISARLGMRCEAVDIVDSPRRRKAVIQRIAAGSYDIVLVAHGFAGHGDTELLAAAAKRAGCLFRLVDKGRIGKIVTSLSEALGVGSGA